MKAVLVALFVLTLTASVAADDPADVLRAMKQRYGVVTTYTARFVRQERVAGVLRPREEAMLKFQRPGRLYLRWVDGPPVGREIIFVPGRDGDNVLVHEPRGIAGLFTALMTPDNERVREESRHAVTDIGIGRLVDLVHDNVERARRRDDLRIVDLGINEEAGRRRRRIELHFANAEQQGYYAPRIVVVIDAQLGLPTGIIAFDADDRLLALYDYRDVRLNVELGAQDFDPSNPDYSFPRWRVTL